MQDADLGELTRKKSTPDAKNLAWQKKGGAGVPTGPGAGGGSSGGTLSPQVNKRVVGAGQEASSSAHSSSGTSGSSSSSKLRHAATCEANLSVTLSQQDTSHATEDPEMFDSSATMASNGGSSSDVGADDFDSADGTGQDPTRTKAALEHISKKINCTMDQIRDEQNLKEENVNEYLRLSANADRQQQQRIKTVFEKRNQKSTQSIAQLQRKLEVYQKRHREVETYGVSGHKQAKEVLRDVGHGLKGVVDNIRGAKETIVSKPKEFAHLIKNRFGSADNIPNLKYEEGQTEGESDVNIRHHGSGTLPANYKFPSDDDASSVRSSGSGPSAGAHSSPHPTLPHGVGPPSSAIMNQFYATRESSSAPTPTTDLEVTQQILTELFVVKEMNVKLQDTIETMRSQMLDDCRQLKQAIEEERYRSERLEEQINDQTELHQHEVTNIKQELSSMEEKMEYQLEERTRDMQELLDTCRTSITKMELQQQQQQLISMEGIENSNFRALLTKMINVVLAILAVVLVFVSTVANLLGPFLTTRVRILSTIALIAAIVLAWQNWHLAEDFGQYLIEKYRRIVPAQ